MEIFSFSRFRIIDLQHQDSLLMDMKVDVCLSDAYDCYLQAEILNRQRVPKPFCGEFGLTIPGLLNLNSDCEGNIKLQPFCTFVQAWFYVFYGNSFDFQVLS